MHAFKPTCNNQLIAWQRVAAVLLLFGIIGFFYEVIRDSSASSAQTISWEGLLRSLIGYGICGVAITWMLARVGISPFADKQVIALEDELADAETLRQVGLMAGGLVQTLRSYLGLLESTTATMARHGDDAALLRDSLKTQNRTLFHTRRIIDQLTQYVRGDTVTARVRRPINEVVSDAIDLGVLLFPELKRTIELRLADDAPIFEINDILLMQCLIGILRRSIDAAPEGSEIVVESSVARQSSGSAFVVVRIIDTELRSSELFGDGASGAFRRAARSPAGLTLAAMQELLRREGAHLAVSPTPAEGSVIEIQYQAGEYAAFKGGSAAPLTSSTLPSVG